MSILYCFDCDLYIDTDYEAEHFDEEMEKCVATQDQDPTTEN